MQFWYFDKLFFRFKVYTFCKLDISFRLFKIKDKALNRDYMVEFLFSR